MRSNSGNIETSAWLIQLLGHMYIQDLKVSAKLCLNLS